MSVPNSPYEQPPQPYSQPGYPPGNPPQPALVLGIISVALGALGFFSNCGCLGCVFMPLPPLAIVLGIIALTQKPDQTAKVLAICGIACGALSLLLWVLFIALGVGSAVLNHPQLRPNR